MKKLNLVVVLDDTLEKGLFCIRAKDPYKGMYNTLVKKRSSLKL